MADVETPTPEEQETKTPHAGGRPLKYQTVKDLDMAIQTYFDTCDPHVIYYQAEAGRKENGETIWQTRTKYSDQKPYTMAGLARAIGVDRKTLLSYSERDEFLPSIKAAKQRCEEYAESQLFGPYANGAKFNLVNNYRTNPKSTDWADKQEVDHTSAGERINPLGGLSVEELRKLAQEE